MIARLGTLQRTGRHIAVPVIATLIAGGVLGWQLHVNQVTHTQIGALSTALDQQRSQAQRSGQTPVAPAPKDILASPGIVKGDRGDTGPAGRGLAALWCTDGRWQVSYTDGMVIYDAGACTGPPGIPGVAGSPGPAGGLGPAGPQGVGATGPPGSAGPAGANGPAGPSGASGADGKPPAGWQWTDTAGIQYQCDREATSPDSAPRYICRRTSPLGS